MAKTNKDDPFAPTAESIDRVGMAAEEGKMSVIDEREFVEACEPDELEQLQEARKLMTEIAFRLYDKAEELAG